MQKQTLGDRMKSYENVTRYSLPHKSFVVARIDGKGFSKYTKGLQRPFDQGFVDDMNATAIYLCQEIQNAKFAFVQSDEISILIHESEQDSEPWFDNGLQKMASVAASLAAAKFNQLRMLRTVWEKNPKDSVEAVDVIANKKLAAFDARFWTIPTVNEVVNYFMWRQQDCTKNSVASVAQANFSHKQLEGKHGGEMQDMLFLQKGINWNDFPSGLKRGRFIEKVTYDVPALTFRDNEQLRSGKGNVAFTVKDGNIAIEGTEKPGYVTRSKWDVVECPIFSKDKEFLLDRIKVNY